MASQVDSLNRSFVADVAISAFRLVKLHTTENEVVAATNGAAIGFTQDDASADQTVNVKLFHPTFLAIADGKVASAGGISMGYAINAGTTNDIIEIVVPAKPFI